MPLKEHLMHATAVLFGAAALGCGLLAFKNPWWVALWIPFIAAGWAANSKASKMFEQRQDRHFQDFKAKCRSERT